MTRPDGWYDVSKEKSVTRLLIVHGRVLFWRSLTDHLIIPFGTRNYPVLPPSTIGEPPPDPEGWTWRRLEP